MDTLNELEGADSVGVARTLAAKPEVSLKVTGPDWAGGDTLKGGARSSNEVGLPSWHRMARTRDVFTCQRGRFQVALRTVCLWLSGSGALAWLKNASPGADTVQARPIIPETAADGGFTRVAAQRLVSSIA